MDESQGAGRPLPADAAIALASGRTIDAIKSVRTAEGLGLLEAKIRIETAISGNPGLRAQVEAARADAKRRLIRWVLIADAVIIAIIVWWFFGR